MCSRRGSPGTIGETRSKDKSRARAGAETRGDGSRFASESCSKANRQRRGSSGAGAETPAHGVAQERGNVSAKGGTTEQRAFERRATGSLEKTGLPSSERSSDGQRSHLKRGVASTGLTHPVLGAVRRLTAEGALRATTDRERSDGQRATGNGQRAASSEQRAAGNGRRATGDAQRATGSERRAASSLEKRGVSHGVSKPRVGRRSKTHGGRCASRNHRQRAQQRAMGDAQRATDDEQRTTSNDDGQRESGSELT
jgi:hypothetical protein